MPPAAAAQPAASDSTFRVDEKVLCFHGPMLYEAKVLDVQAQTDDKPAAYKVHYKGWKNTWDEYVGPDRLRKMTDENIRLQNELKQNGRPPAGSSARGRPPNPDKHKQKAGSEDGSMGGAGLPRGQKRNRELGLDDEESFMNRPEIKLNMHDDFKALLVDDWENVTKNQQLVPLPRKPSVVEIIDGYRDYYIRAGNIQGLTDPAKADSVNSAEKDVLDEFCSGLKLYFDKSLGNSLLYRFERQQYADLLKEFDATKAMSEVYGAEHLLRLIVLMPELIAQTAMDQQSIGKLRFHIDYLLRYMHKDMRAFFSEGYEAGMLPSLSAIFSKTTLSSAPASGESSLSGTPHSTSSEGSEGSTRPKRTGLIGALNSRFMPVIAVDDDEETASGGEQDEEENGSRLTPPPSATFSSEVSSVPPTPSMDSVFKKPALPAKVRKALEQATPLTPTPSTTAPLSTSASSRAQRYERKLAEEKAREAQAQNPAPLRETADPITDSPVPTTRGRGRGRARGPGRPRSARGGRGGRGGRPPAVQATLAANWNFADAQAPFPSPQSAASPTSTAPTTPAAPVSNSGFTPINSPDVSPLSAISTGAATAGIPMDPAGWVKVAAAEREREGETRRGAPKMGTFQTSLE